MKEKIIVTAALPYANGDIHIGHLLEYIQADIYSRFLKLTDNNSLYICASDMHGTPIEINAKNAGITPEKFANSYWKEHQKDFANFLINFDNYYKTHSPENEELANFFFKELKKKNLIYLKKIPVIFCNSCKRSLPDRLVKGNCPHCKAEDQYGDICEKCNTVLKGFDLVKPRCSICNSSPIQKESQHYFFKLSLFSKDLEKWINLSHVQKEVKNWLNEWLKNGLEDWCISRDSPYFGFKIPEAKKETGEEKYFYVWLDAPIGYISSTKNYTDKKNLKWEDFWKHGKVHHIIGKDIAYFHYLFWPAMLKAVGIPLPQLTTHGFITVNGEKMSKSRGTFFTAKDFLKLYPAESLRFYYASHLDRKVIDVDLSFQELQAVNNNVLTGNLGNFCYRVLSFAEKNYQNIKEISDENKLNKEIDNLIKRIYLNYSELDFKSAVKNILKIADIGNSYFQKSEPWKSKDSNETKASVGWCVNLAKNLSILVSPILPEFSRKIFSSLSLDKVSWKNLNKEFKGKLSAPQLLVQKIEEIFPFKTESFSKTERFSKPETFPLKLVFGKIEEIKDHPNADSLYLLKVNFGNENRQVVAGLKKYKKPEELLHQQAVFCVNLKPAKLRGELSQAMILVAEDKKGIYLLQLDSAKIGDQAQFGNLPSSEQEITFEEFSKLKLVVKHEKIIYQGKTLNSKGREIVVKNIEDGSKVR